MSRFLVYGLVDPRTHELRYIGASICGLTRPKRHTLPSVLRRERSHKRNWLLSLIREGLLPRIEVLQFCADVTEVMQIECEMIICAKYQGFSLTNLTDGGMGLTGYTPTSETREKLSRAGRGRKHSVEHIQNQSAATRGKKRSLAQRLHMSRQQGGGPISDQFGRRYASQMEAAKQLGIPQSSVSSVLNGRRVRTHGLMFQWVSS